MKFCYYAYFIQLWSQAWEWALFTESYSCKLNCTSGSINNTINVYIQWYRLFFGSLAKLILNLINTPVASSRRLIEYLTSCSVMRWSQKSDRRRQRFFDALFRDSTSRHLNFKIVYLAVGLEAAAEDETSQNYELIFQAKPSASLSRCRVRDTRSMPRLYNQNQQNRKRKFN